jgi:hypothetical protein
LILRFSIALLAIPSATAAAQPTSAPVPAAEPGAEDASRPRADESLDLARLSLSGSYFRGTMLAGRGSVRSYQGVGSTLDIDVVRFFHPRLGLEVALQVSPDLLAFGGGGNGYGGMSGAFDVAPIVGERGSVTIGAGAGFDVGERYWWSEVRGYPLAIVRARWLPLPELGIHGAYGLIPVTTGPHRVLENRLEVGFGWSLFHAGVRGAATRVQGGEPERTFGELELGAFIGIGVFR